MVTFRRELMRTFVSFVLGAVLGGPAIATAQGWTKQLVQLGWVKQPSPDETGSSRQSTKLLGQNELQYTKRGEVEDYEVTSGPLNCSIMVRKGTPFSMMVGGGAGFYHIDRSSGKAAEVFWNQRPLRAIPASDDVLGPNG
jgi:hypothetical protein